MIIIVITIKLWSLIERFLFPFFVISAKSFSWFIFLPLSLWYIFAQQKLRKSACFFRAVTTTAPHGALWILLKRRFGSYATELSTSEVIRKWLSRRAWCFHTVSSWNRWSYSGSGSWTSTPQRTQCLASRLLCLYIAPLLNHAGLETSTRVP